MNFFQLIAKKGNLVVRDKVFRFDQRQRKDADLVIFCIGKLEGELGGLNIKCTNTWLSPLQQIWPMLQ